MSESHYHHLLRNNSADSNNALQNTSSTSTLYKASTGSGGEIHHTHQILEQISGLLNNEQCSDVTLIVEGTRIPAHRLVLGMRSNYFWAMLYSGMRESREPEITLVDTPLQAFKILLKYIYTGRMQFHSLNFDLLIEVLSLAHKYGFVELESEIAQYLKSTLNARNVCCVYCTAHLYSMNGLLTPCLDFIDNFAADVLTTQGFLLLPATILQQLISRNTFCAPEIEIFNAVARWIDSRPEEADSFDFVLDCIRLPLIKLDDLLSMVRPSGLIHSDKLLDAIGEQKQKRSSDLVYRGILCPNLNVADSSMNAKVLVGEFPTALFTSRKGFLQDHERKFTRHPINSSDPGIIIELGRPFIINHLRLWLPDREQRNQTYSYYIEVSMDRNDWVRVIDHTKYLCRSMQNLFFNERVVKYVRICGTYNSLHGTFNLMGFEAFYTTEIFEIDPETTLLIPKHNVATETPGCATVIEGVSRGRNVLLDGNVENYDWDDGYTCHQLGSGAITVQFPQPYLLESMRLLLWDCDERTYSFYIEVSYDQNQWTKIVEVTHRRSWQTLTFNRLPVVFVRIVGTENSANEVFHVVHFETPVSGDVEKSAFVQLFEAASTSAAKNRNGMVEQIPEREMSAEINAEPAEEGMEIHEENQAIEEEDVVNNEEGPQEQNNN